MAKKVGLTQVNDGFDRIATITARITEGTTSESATLQVKNLGLREEFVPSDEDEHMRDVNGEEFGVLKNM